MARGLVVLGVLVVLVLGLFVFDWFGCGLVVLGLMIGLSVLLWVGWV